MTLIFDVGSHTGEDTEFYLEKGFSVIAVEANPALAEALAYKFPDAVKAGKLTVINGAIAEEAGAIDFYINKKNTAWSTSDPKWAARNARRRAPSVKVTVPAIVFKSLISEYGVPHYLKIDIEGAGFLCLQALASFAVRPAYVSFEASPENWGMLCQEFRLLRSLGYRGFKIINQRDVPAQSPPQPAAEGQYTPRILKGSSGLFGRELSGEWLSAGDALKAYKPIAVNHLRFGDGTLGRMIVRRTPILRSFRRRILPSYYDTHARHGSQESQTIGVV